MTFTFTAPVWHWKGPAPHHFLVLPPELVERVKKVANKVTYGWGMIPVRARIGETEFETAMWPMDGGYILPLRADTRKKEGIGVDDLVTAWVEVVGAPEEPGDEGEWLELSL
jgi:hypothetical protein